MSTNRKILKVVSIISLVLDLLLVIFGVLLFAGISLDPNGAIDAAAQNPVAGFTSNQTVGMLLAAAVAAIIFGLWDVFVSIMGIRGANNPSKMGFVTVIAGISLVIAIVGVVASIVSGSFNAGELVELIIEIIFFYICYKVREEGKKLA